MVLTNMMKFSCRWRVLSWSHCCFRRHRGINLPQRSTNMWIRSRNNRDSYLPRKRQFGDDPARRVINVLQMVVVEPQRITCFLCDIWESSSMHSAKSIGPVRSKFAKRECQSQIPERHAIQISWICSTRNRLTYNSSRPCFVCYDIKRWIFWNFIKKNTTTPNRRLAL